MKNKNIVMSIVLVISTVLFISTLWNSVNPNPDRSLPNINNEFRDIGDSTIKIDEVIGTNYNKSNVVVVVEDPVVKNKFDYVYKRFKVFNPDLDSSTVDVFNRVSEHYKLSNSGTMLQWCIGQILLESGAKQYYETKHPKSGQLVKSSSGAIGISQITSTTAYGYLTKYIDEDDVIDMSALGCTDFEYIVSDSCGRGEGINLTREWLKNETNNLILWGYIMRNKLDRIPNIVKVLVSYNAGTVAMKRFLNNGGSLYDHKYIRGIRYKLRYAETKLMSSNNH